MSRQIVLVVAVLLAALAAGGLLAPGGRGLSAAQEASPAATQCPATTEEENEALVRRVLEEVWGAGDLAALDELVADDYVLDLPAGVVVSAPWLTPPPGRSALETAVQQLREDFPDLRITLDDLAADGDTVAVRMTWSGTQADDLELLGAPNTGRRTEWAVVTFYRIACGQIVEAWVLPDNLTQLRQLGIITNDELATVGTPSVATPVP